jgi:hypothetical protein
MSEFDGPVLLMMWLVLMPFAAIALRALFGSFRIVASVLILNAIVLIIFCGLWYWGYYFSEHWMHIIDLGAPWSWLGALFAVSYATSFLPLRKHSKAIAKSFVGPLITLPAMWAWILFCALLFDPFP